MVSHLGAALAGDGALLGELREFSGLPAFYIESFESLHTGLAVLVDASHFVMASWDTNDMRGHVGPSYDVVFSRPGVAELNARDVWRRFARSDQYKHVCQHLTAAALEHTSSAAKRAHT